MKRELRIQKAISTEQQKKKVIKTKNILAKRGMQKKRLKKSEREENQNEMKKIKKFAKNRDLDDKMDVEMMDRIFVNNGVVPQTMIRKRIQKLKKKGIQGPKAVRLVNKLKKAAHKKLEDQIFNKGDQMKKRRDDRNRQSVKNSKKAAQFKNSLKQKTKP